MGNATWNHNSSLSIDLDSALDGIGTVYKILRYRGRELSELESIFILDYGRALGYKSLNEITDADIDLVLRPFRTKHLILSDNIKRTRIDKIKSINE